MQDRGPSIAGVNAGFLTVSILAVGIRSYVRLALTKSFGYDDWIMVITLILYTFYCSVALLGVHDGVGKHTNDLSTEKISAALEMWWLAEILYGFSSTFTKLAGGTLLLRLTTKRLHNHIIWAIMTLAILFGVAFIAQIIAQCQPVSFFWSVTRDPVRGHCVDSRIVVGFTYAHAAVSSLGDWTFGILPAFIVRGLNMNFRSKLSVFLILCLANVGSVATLIRIKAIHQISDSQDFLFAAADLAIWSSVEVGIAIIAASIATYRPLFRKFYSIGGSGGNLTALTTINGHRIGSPMDFRQGTPQNIGLEQINSKTGHKDTLWQTSSAEMFRRADSGVESV